MIVHNGVMQTTFYEQRLFNNKLISLYLARHFARTDTAINALNLTGIRQECVGS